MPAPGHLTELQEKWFASVRAAWSATRDGRWSNGPRSRGSAPRPPIASGSHNLGQNHASMALNAAFPPEASWSRPAALIEGLWADAEQRRLFETVRPFKHPADVLTGFEPAKTRSYIPVNRGRTQRFT